MKFFRTIACFLLLAALHPGLRAQELLAVPEERDFTGTEIIETLYDSFGFVFEKYGVPRKLDRIAPLLDDLHAAVLLYRTVDPTGKPVTASGLVVWPQHRHIQGVIEISPITKPLSSCGSSKVLMPEDIPAGFGYAILIPDMIGYGSTEGEPVTFLINDATARVAADLRKAAETYFRTYRSRALPRSSIIAGYSIGATSALALARFYHLHPEYNVHPKALFIGGGMYDARTAVESYSRSGRMDYFLIPSLAWAFDQYFHLGLDFSKIFTGEVLADFERVHTLRDDPLKLAERYGSDLHGYMHPDFFTPERNDDLNRLLEAMDSQTLIYDGIRRDLDRKTDIFIFHSAQDQIVPVECADALYRRLYSPFRNTHYLRSPRESHHSEGILFLTEVLAYLLINPLI